MSAVIARIALRYLAGVLVAYGVIGSGDVGILLDDPALERELATAIGAAIGLVVETAYGIAKRAGWAT